MKQCNFIPSNAGGVLHDIKTLSNESLSEEYGIHIDKNGIVWDEVEGRHFKNTKEWAEYLADLEDASQCAIFVKMSGKQYFDDE